MGDSTGFSADFTRLNLQKATPKITANYRGERNYAQTFSRSPPKRKIDNLRGNVRVLGQDCVQFVSNRIETAFEVAECYLSVATSGCTSNPSHIFSFRSGDQVRS